MADSQLVGLARHYRHQAEQDALLVDLAVRYHKRRSHLRRRIRLWHSVADEIDAYLAGELEEHVPDPDQPTLMEGP